MRENTDIQTSYKLLHAGAERFPSYRPAALAAPTESS